MLLAIVRVCPVVANVDDPTKLALRAIVPVDERMIVLDAVDAPLIVRVPVLLAAKVVQAMPLVPIVIVALPAVKVVPENPLTLTVPPLAENVVPPVITQFAPVVDPVPLFENAPVSVRFPVRVAVAAVFVQVVKLVV